MRAFRSITAVAAAVTVCLGTAIASAAPAAAVPVGPAQTVDAGRNVQPGAVDRAPAQLPPRQHAPGQLSTASSTAATLTITTANVQGVGDPRRAQPRARAAIKEALDPRLESTAGQPKRPDVVLLQETRGIPVATIVADLAKQNPAYSPYRVLNPGRLSSATHEVAILVNTDRLGVVEYGSVLAYHVAGVDPVERTMLWAKLRDRTTDKQFVAVSVHYPKGSTRSAAARHAYQLSNAALQRLVHRFRTEGGLPFIAGGDWNGGVRQPGTSWQPVRFAESLKLTTNWRLASAPKDAACGRGTTDSQGGSFIDGFALGTGRISVKTQHCYNSRASDHDVVAMQFTVRV